MPDDAATQKDIEEEISRRTAVKSDDIATPGDIDAEIARRLKGAAAQSPGSTLSGLSPLPPNPAANAPSITTRQDGTPKSSTLSTPAPTILPKGILSGVQAGIRPARVPKPLSLREQAAQIVDQAIAQSHAERSQYNPNPLGPASYVLQPITSLLSMGARAAAERMPVPSVTGMGMGTTGVGGSGGPTQHLMEPSPLQKEVYAEVARRTRGMNPLQATQYRMAVEGAGGFLRKVAPDVTRYVETPGTGSEGFAKGLLRTGQGLTSDDNLALMAAMGTPILAGKAGVILQKAASGGFGAAAFKQAWDKIHEWNKGGRKDSSLLGEAVGSGVVGGAAGWHAVGGIKGIKAGMKAAAEAVRTGVDTAPGDRPFFRAKPASGGPIAVTPEMASRRAAAEQAVSGQFPEYPPNTKAAPRPPVKPTPPSNVSVAMNMAVVQEGNGKTSRYPLPADPADRAEFLQALRDEYDKPQAPAARPTAAPVTTPPVQAEAPTSPARRPKTPTPPVVPETPAGTPAVNVEPVRAMPDQEQSATIFGKPVPNVSENVDSHPLIQKAIKEYGTTSSGEGGAWITPGGKIIPQGGPSHVEAEHYYMAHKMLGADPSNIKDRVKTTRDFMRQTGMARYAPTSSGVGVEHETPLTEAQKQTIIRIHQKGLAFGIEGTHNKVTGFAGADNATGIDVRRAIEKVHSEITRAKPEEVLSAIQEQGAGAQVLRPEGPPVELPGVGKGNKPEVTAGKSEAKPEAPQEVAARWIVQENPSGDGHLLIDTRTGKMDRSNTPSDMVSKSGLQKIASRLNSAKTPQEASPPPAKPAPNKSATVALSANEAATLSGYFPEGHSLGKKLEGGGLHDTKDVSLTAAEADTLRTMVKNKKLDPRNFPTLFGKGPYELHSGIDLSSLKKAISPASIDVHSATNARLGRRLMGQYSREAMQAERALRAAGEAFDRIPVGQALDFMFDMEAGAPQKDSTWDPVATTLRRALDEEKARVQALGPGHLDSTIANYFPHMWKHPKRAGAFYGEGTTPLRGSEQFRRRRSIMTNAEGMFPNGVPANIRTMTESQVAAEIKAQGGLEPLSYNPAVMALLKIQQMRKYRMGQSWVQEMKDRGKAGDPGGATWLFEGKAMPDGYAPLNDKVFKSTQRVASGVLQHGKWIAPEGAAMIINNYLSPNIRSNELAGPTYRVLNALNNALNMAQLSVSGFHASTTAFNSIFSEAGRGLQAALEGRPLKAADAILNAWQAPLRDYYEGSQILQEYRNPGTVGGDIPSLVQHLVDAGGQVELGKEFRLNAIEKFRQGIRQRKAVPVALSTLPAALEATMAPLMRDAVPKIKLGAFAELMRDEMEKYPGATEEEKLELATRAWDTIEDRFGQVNYGNWFWHNVFLDLAHISTRSLGWTGGTWRGGFGSIHDITNTRARLNSGPTSTAPTGKLSKVLTPRQQYTIALFLGTAAAGALYTYMHTGKPPKSVEDYFHPIGPEGLRMNLPTYVKNYEKLWAMPIPKKQFSLPWSTKSPLFDLAVETAQGKDYIGRPISNSVPDYLVYLTKQFVPFSARGTGENRDDNPVEAIKHIFTTPQGRERMLGITPAEYPKSSGGGGSPFGKAY